MQLTLGNVISMATNFAGRSDFSASEVSLLANIALTEVANRVNHKSLEANAVSNVTGTGSERRILLPSDFNYAIGLKYYSTSTNSLGVNVIGDGTDLPIVSATLLDSFSSTTGTPTRYLIYGDYMELDPIPGSRGSLALRYATKQPTLVASTETPTLDDRWHVGWLNKTEEYVHRARGNSAGALEAERRYVNYMTSTLNDRGQEQMAKHGQGLWLRRKD